MIAEAMTDVRTIIQNTDFGESFLGDGEVVVASVVSVIVMVGILVTILEDCDGFDDAFD